MEPDAGERLLRELTAWDPEGGVVSVYLAIDHADRSEGWRIELKDRLAGVDRKVADRILARFRRDAPPPTGRTQIGYVEVGGERREIWNGFQMDGIATEVVAAGRPYLVPLVRMLDDGSPVGVVVVSLERVRVLGWALGQIEELDGWELEITSLDWHERKAPRRDPARGTGASASGRDQHAQRLEHNRERFLKQAGGLVASRYGDRPWRRIVVIGEGDRPRLLAMGTGPKRELVHEVRHDLIRAGAAEIGERLTEELEHLNRSREEALIAELNEAIGAGPGAALGPDEVLETLAEGRVRHVIFDGAREFEQHDGVPASELMIERALATRAQVTPVEGLAAASLREHDGAAALLRY
ncbi:MAG: VLRF1 family aeRF1-type release factor [Solirubrobacterales bacterium]